MWDFKEKVTIHSFRKKFVAWLKKVHRKVIRKWLSQHPSNDFRSSIIANLQFLRKEAVGVLGEKTAYRHTLWAEVDMFKHYKEPSKGLMEVGLSIIVTTYIFDCFQNLPSGDRLKKMPLSEQTEKLRKQTIRERQLELLAPLNDDAIALSVAAEERIKENESETRSRQIVTLKKRVLCGNERFPMISTILIAGLHSCRISTSSEGSAHLMSYDIIDPWIPSAG